MRPRVDIPVADLTSAIRTFESRYQVAEENPQVTAQLLTLLEQNISRQVHDTNIVATMLVYGIRRILTNNPEDFAPFAGVITIVPLT